MRVRRANGVCASLLRTWVQAQEKMVWAAACKIHYQNKVILVAPVSWCWWVVTRIRFDIPSFCLGLSNFLGNGHGVGGENIRPAAACSCCAWPWALRLFAGYGELKTWSGFSLYRKTSRPRYSRLLRAHLWGDPVHFSTGLCGKCPHHSLSQTRSPIWQLKLGWMKLRNIPGPRSASARRTKPACDGSLWWRDAGILHKPGTRVALQCLCSNWVWLGSAFLPTISSEQQLMILPPSLHLVFPFFCHFARCLSLLFPILQKQLLH